MFLLMICQGFNTSKTVLRPSVTRKSGAKNTRTRIFDGCFGRRWNPLVGWWLGRPFFDGGKPKHNGWFSYFSKGKVFIYIPDTQCMIFFFWPLFPDICSISMVQNLQRLSFYCTQTNCSLLERDSSLQKRTVYNLPRFFLMKRCFRFLPKKWPPRN